MSLIPIIQPPIMKAFDQQSRPQNPDGVRSASGFESCSCYFPHIVTVAISIISPAAAPLIAALMLGNLLKESGVVPRLDKAAQNEITNVSTLFMGLAIGGIVTGEQFLSMGVLFILALGLLAFILDTVAGVLFGQLMKDDYHAAMINPLIGACGISAFPKAGGSLPNRIG